ncbi:LacI family DNA-binding transcriptional regulator [Fodinicola feengrottensis]|uniref:LacI family DNA-binding transcriptional regulator n=2 Tax=Fodinicola feengrottensis TaxID=435914 RepID=A0ABN2G8Y6_9ACTN
MPVYHRTVARKLADVAEHLGVSQATVSRALNGKPGISDATRAAVLTALDVLGYERPAKLRGETARLVGVVLPDMQNPIYASFAEAVAGALAKRGITAVLCPRTVDGVNEADFVELLIEQQVSGVLFASGLYQYATASKGHYALLRARSLPTVLINAAVPGFDVPSVCTDEEHAVGQAYSHLTHLGHRRIGAVLGPREHMPSARKLAAYRALGGSPELVAHAGFTIEEGHSGALPLIAAGATGVICGNDVLAMGAVRAARKLGREVPREVSVVGFDDSGLMAYTDPPLTTVRQPIVAMAHAAVDLLLRQIDAEVVPTDAMLFEPELVVRASTAPAPR